MNTRIGWKTAVVVMGFTSAVWAAEMTQTEYRAPANEAPRAEVTTRVKAQATVVKIDQATRMITLKNEAGETFETKVGPEVQRFDQIKAGDIVMVDYVESEALYVKKAAKGEKPEHTGDATMTRAPGTQPAAAMGATEKMSAEVMNVDYKKRMITLKSPNGDVSTMHVPEKVRRLSEIKKGDHVVAERTVAVAIAVTKP